MACKRRLELLPLLLLFLYCRLSGARTVAVDELARWERPVLHVGDSVVFRAVELSGVYMFHSRRAYKFCILSQATLLHSAAGGAPSTSYFSWRPSRPGEYYFARANETLDSCDVRERAHLTVLPPSPAPPPTAGDDGGDFLPSLPHARRFTPSSPSPGAAAPPPASGGGSSPPATAPSASPAGSDGGIALISSNPAIPLPTGASDSTATRPLPDAGGGQPAAGRTLGVQMALSVALAAPFALWSI